MLSALLLPGIPAAGETRPAPAAAPAAAAEDEEHEHMALDLAGTPISTIEKQTAANAARVQRRTGLRPGTAMTSKGALAAADPAQTGEWSPVADTPVVPVFQAVLPNGKVLIWDSVGDNSADTYPDHTFTRAMVWNPADNTYKRVDVQGSNIFCAGFAHLSNGNILVAGGNADQQMDGTVLTHIFDWQTETWTRGADMAGARWYPAVAETANGEEVIIGGGPSISEVYQNDGTIRELTGFTKYPNRLYPSMGSRPDTQLAFFGPYATGYTITTSGTGVITATSTRDTMLRDYGSFSTYDIGKTIVVGGGNMTENGVAHVPTRTAVVMNSTAATVPTFSATGSMSIGRRQFNSTLLADGSVLATGGLTSAATNTLVDLDHAATTAERWDPATGQWTVLASASRIRQYHSAAVLLPDGRVMTGGGGVCGVCMTVGYMEKNVEYFTPPYLLKKADRPVISAAPATVGIDSPFKVSSSRASTIAKVALVGLGDATHGIDQGQRYVPLKFSASGNDLTVTGPPTGGVAPPGYYMLFLVDKDGVPSVAKMVQVSPGPKPLMSPVKNSTGRCVDVTGASIAAKTYLQGYDCNGTMAQALTRFPDDNSLRVLGNCLEVTSPDYIAGQRIWADTCKHSVVQTWKFGTDGTIRPLGDPGMCLAAASADNKAAVILRLCTRNALQKWTW